MCRQGNHDPPGAQDAANLGEPQRVKAAYADVALVSLTKGEVDQHGIHALVWQREASSEVSLGKRHAPSAPCIEDAERGGTDLRAVDVEANAAAPGMAQGCLDEQPSCSLSTPQPPQPRRLCTPSDLHWPYTVYTQPRRTH